MCLPKGPDVTIEREWTANGLQCAVTLVKGRHRCGYVRVPPGHPLHGVSFCGDETDVVDDLSVHGGITFAEIEPCSHDDGTGWWFGFDCAHCYDAMYDPQKPMPGELLMLSSLWHHGTQGHYWTFDEVVKECEQLALQLSAVAVAHA